jgi:hypothetical protein
MLIQTFPALIKHMQSNPNDAEFIFWYAKNVSKVSSLSLRIANKALCISDRCRFKYIRLLKKHGISNYAISERF